MPKQFFVSLKAMIQNDNGDVMFLVKKKGDTKYLDLPGGRVEGSDNFEESIQRELAEELSISPPIQVKKQVGPARELPSQFIKDENRQIVIVYLVETNIENIELSNEHIEVKWISSEDMNNLDEKYVLLEGYRQNLESLYN